MQGYILRYSRIWSKDTYIPTRLSFFIEIQTCHSTPRTKCFAFSPTVRSNRSNSPSVRSPKDCGKYYPKKFELFISLPIFAIPYAKQGATRKFSVGQSETTKIKARNLLRGKCITFNQKSLSLQNHNFPRYFRRKILLNPDPNTNQTITPSSNPPSLLLFIIGSIYIIQVLNRPLRSLPFPPLRALRTYPIIPASSKNILSQVSPHIYATRYDRLEI